MTDAILDAIEQASLMTSDQQKEKAEADRDKAASEALMASLRRGAEDDAKRWERFERLHGKIPERTDVEYFPEGHPYAGFAMTTHTTPDPLRARKCREEAEQWRKDTDAWCERLVGPPRPRRKKKRKKEAEADPERQLLAARQKEIF